MFPKEQCCEFNPEVSIEQEAKVQQASFSKELDQPNFMQAFEALQDQYLLSCKSDRNAKYIMSKLSVDAFSPATALEYNNSSSKSSFLKTGK